MAQSLNTSIIFRAILATCSKWVPPYYAQNTPFVCLLWKKVQRNGGSFCLYPPPRPRRCQPLSGARRRTWPLLPPAASFLRERASVRVSMSIGQQLYHVDIFLEKNTPVLQVSTALGFRRPADFTQKGAGRGLRPPILETISLKIQHVSQGAIQAQDFIFA